MTTQRVTYIGSLFVSGSVTEKSLNFLVDTGSTHKLLSRTVFDCEPAQKGQQMVYRETMVDGSGLHIHGSISLLGRLRNVRFEARLLVSDIRECHSVDGMMKTTRLLRGLR